MRHWRIIYLFLIFIYSSKLFAVDGPVLLNRICLNNFDTIVTLQWTNQSDVCVSFVNNHIYGREGSGPFLPMSVPISTSVNSWQIKLPNLNPSWEFYIVTSRACNGLDSFLSNTLSIDLSKPPISQIDSVSIDFATQKISIGWQMNTANDKKGYRIYQYNAGINDSLSDTTAVNYLLYQNPNNDIQITISAYDSCSLYAPISDPHKPISLSTSFDTCTKRVTLNWSTYIGWTTEEHTILINKNGQSYETYTFLPGSSLNSIYDSITLGDSVCFLIRAHKFGDPKISSTSNESCIYSRSKISPNLNYISQVTVQNNKTIMVNWLAKNTSDVSKIELQKSVNNSSFKSIYSSSIISQELSYEDNKVDVSKDLAKYKVVLFDQCNISLSESNTSSNILLTLDKQMLNWSDYIGWYGNKDGFSVFYGFGSTWNPLISNINQVSYTFATDPVLTSSECFFVLAEEINNPSGINAFSKSNVVCKTLPFSYFVPNTIVPDGVNNKFVILGNNIDLIKSSYSVFNRWGERIFQSIKITDPWFGDYNDTNVPAGIYFFVATIYSLNDEIVNLSGEIRVLR